MKCTGKILLVVALMALTGSCTWENAMTPESEHPVGKSTEGAYDVYFESEIIGHLKLSGGQYHYSPQSNSTSQPKNVDRRLFFLKYPEGRYAIEYYGSVNQSTLLENLDEYAILLRIRFESSQADNPNATSDDSPPVEDLFIISKNKSALDLSSAFGQLQRWSVTKLWK